ncbi:MAG: hypothetical protein ACXWYD_07830 [Candidatus Binatia bacterium]
MADFVIEFVIIARVMASSMAAGNGLSSAQPSWAKATQDLSASSIPFLEQARFYLGK